MAAKTTWRALRESRDGGRGRGEESSFAMHRCGEEDMNEGEYVKNTL